MANAPRELIADNLATTLAAITVAGGYKSTVVTVERVLKSWDEVGNTARMPWLGFMFEVEQVQHEPGGMLWCRLPFAIVGHLPSTDATRTSDVNDILDDITKALNTDTTRSANAVQTTITESTSDEADPDLTNAKGGGASIQVKGVIEYQRTVQGS